METSVGYKFFGNLNLNSGTSIIQKELLQTFMGTKSVCTLADINFRMISKARNFFKFMQSYQLLNHKKHKDLNITSYVLLTQSLIDFLQQFIFHYTFLHILFEKLI